MAVLGWSPTMRSLLRLKRKSSPDADECEDGARAIFAEEGLAAVLSRLAPRSDRVSEHGRHRRRRNRGRQGRRHRPRSRGGTGLALAGRHSPGIPRDVPASQNDGGYLIADLDARDLAYRKVLAT